MSASSRETSKAAGEIVASAEQLRGTAEELARLVSEFRLTAEASMTDSTTTHG